MSGQLFLTQLVQTWNSESCPAGQPVFAVTVTRKYRWVVAGKVIAGLQALDDRAVATGMTGFLFSGSLAASVPF